MHTATRVLAAVFAVSVAAGAHSAPRRPQERELRRRALTVDDANLTALPEIHVAKGVSTVLTFPVSLRESEGVFVADVKNVMEILTQSDRVILLVPKQDLSTPLALNATLADGTVLTFKLVSVPTDVDVQVDLTLALERRGLAESATALKASLARVRAQLDECQATSGTAGVTKIASLLVAQDLKSPHTFERMPASGGDKQSRLLVQARWVYRLFGTTFVVLDVDNRDPSRTWVLDRAEVRLAGHESAVEVKVLSAVSELHTLPPDVQERIVVAFTTPPRERNQGVTLSLFERDGGRHVVLENLDL
jgi:uncharacterized protein (TIGR02268 family)